MQEKYRVFLPHLTTRSDLNRVIMWMGSELAVGHHRVRGGDFGDRPDSIPGGLLGADFEVQAGRYRFERVYGGLNWDPELRSPLTEPGVDAQAGEYLLAVRRVELRPPENLYSRFENTAGKAVEITVGPNSDGSGSRIVTVVPIGNELALRNRDWVEGNMRKVDEATGGRVAYVYVPNTSTLGHAYFKRYFFPQANRDAIIVDERYNGGGYMADYYIDILRRPYASHWNTRYGNDLKTPNASIQGPKVMLIDENAGSGGDMLPWMFRKFGLGKLIGKRTWGGLVGTLGFPMLLDGGVISAPNFAIWVEDQGWIIENVGVPPDIEVDAVPGGRDRRPGPAARAGHRGDHEGAGGEPAPQADDAALSGAGKKISQGSGIGVANPGCPGPGRAHAGGARGAGLHRRAGGGSRSERGRPLPLTDITVAVVSLAPNPKSPKITSFAPVALAVFSMSPGGIA